MVSYCIGADHINDAIDLAIMSRNSIKNNDSWDSMANERNREYIELPWDTSMDSGGREITGKQAIDRWLQNWPLLEYVSRKTEGGLVEQLTGEYRMVNSVVQLPLGGEIGRYLSRNTTLEQLLRQTLFDEVEGLNPLTKSWISFLAEKGYKNGPEITAIGTENMSAEAAIWYRSIITASKHLSEWADAHANHLGIDSYQGRLAYKISTILHELGHNRGVLSEHKLGLLLQEFYEMMAKNFEGRDEEAIYRAIARGEAEYAESHKPQGFSRYLKSCTKSLRNGQGLTESELRELISKYETEGAKKGYRGKDLADYITIKIKRDKGDSKDKKSKESESEDTEQEPGQDSKECKDSEADAVEQEASTEGESE
jgi:hypothetical protein